MEVTHARSVQASLLQIVDKTSTVLWCPSLAIWKHKILMGCQQLLVRRLDIATST